MTSNVVDSTYHANTVSKLNDQIEALGLDIYHMNISIYNSNSNLEKANKETEYWKREAEKNLSRHEKVLKSMSCDQLMAIPKVEVIY